MTAVRNRLVQKLQALPDADVAEVLEFVDFLLWRTARHDESDPLLSVAGIFTGSSPSAEEIERELYGDDRAAR